MNTSDNLKEFISNAEKEGYSKSEIIKHLIKNKKYAPFIKSAKQNEYSDDEILNHLGTKKDKKLFGKEGNLIGGLVGSAVEGGVSRPQSLYEEAPTAALKAIEAPFQTPKFIANAISSMNVPFVGEIGPAKSAEEIFENLPENDRPPILNLPEKTKIPSEHYSDWVREGLTEEEKQNAEAIADVESLLFPFLKKVSGKTGKTKSATSKNIPTEPSSGPKKSLPIHAGRDVLLGAEEKAATFPSGLTQHRVVNAQFPEKAVISPSKQQALLSGLDKEASQLAKKSIEKHLPLSKQIEEGFDFGKMHQKEFGDLKAAAKKYNPEIDITPVTQFLRETRKEFKGVRKLDPEAKKVMIHIESMSRNPTYHLNDLLNNRRANGRLLENLDATKWLKGGQDFYKNFINRLNKKIDESIFNTLPEDSAWASNYKKMNAHYAEYKRTQDVLDMLEPVIGENINTSSLRKLPFNQKAQNKLRVKMGEKGADEIIQIGKDLSTAIDAVKKMSVKEFTKFDAALPLSYLIPGIGKKAALGTAFSYGRRAYGWFLSQPETRVLYDEALTSLAKNDFQSYSRIAEEFKSLKSSQQ